MIEDTINYMWDRSAYPGQSIDSVYPRPSVVMPEVSFAAKNATNAKKHQTSYSECFVSGYYTGAAAATLAISSIAAYNLGRANQGKSTADSLL